MLEEDSINLSQLQDFIEERSINSTNSYQVSPFISKNVSVADDRTGNQMIQEYSTSEEKIREIFNKFKSVKSDKNFNYVKVFIQTINKSFEDYFSKSVKQEPMPIEVPESSNQLLIKPVDFSLLISGKLKQTLDNKIASLQKVVFSAFDTKLRPENFGSLDKKFLGLLHIANPPFRKAIDYNIPLITNLQVADVIVQALQLYGQDDLKIKEWGEYGV